MQFLVYAALWYVYKKAFLENVDPLIKNGF